MAFYSNIDHMTLYRSWVNMYTVIHYRQLITSSGTWAPSASLDIKQQLTLAKYDFSYIVDQQTNMFYLCINTARLQDRARGVVYPPLFKSERSINFLILNNCKKMAK